MLKKWLDARMKERTTWDGAALIILGLNGIVFSTHC